MPNQSQPPRTVRGAPLLNDPAVNKSTSFPMDERLRLRLHGLLPPAVTTIELQEQLVLKILQGKSSDLERYIYLMSLQLRDETLFYKVLIDHLTYTMPLVYTPVVGEACQQFSHIVRAPRGIFISINDLGYVDQILSNWPQKDVRAIVFTDGERILGLGDLGCNGMGIPVGKMALYSACAGIPPQHCLPVMIDVGTDNEVFLADPFYLGLRQKRDRSEKYDQLIDEFMHAAASRFGQSILLQFEDFGNRNAFRLLEKYRDSFCTFNDDIQGTAAVALAGLLTGMLMSKRKLKDHVILFLGAGEAATGMAGLISAAIVESTNCTPEESRKNIYMIDSKGLIVSSRKDLNEQKKLWAKDMAACNDLLSIVDTISPSTLIGASAQPGIFSEKVLKLIAAKHDTPIIFALSNPTSKAECTAEQAYRATNGRCIFASGSPFDPVTIDGRTFVPGQGNNCYIFPGVALGVIAARAKTIPDKIFLRAAQALATTVPQERLEQGCIYPALENIREVSLAIAHAVAKYCFDEGIATASPLDDMKDHIRSMMYVPKYTPFLDPMDETILTRYAESNKAARM